MEVNQNLSVPYQLRDRKMFPNCWGNHAKRVMPILRAANFSDRVLLNIEAI